MRWISRAKSDSGCVSVGGVIVISSPTSVYATRYSMLPPVMPPAAARLARAS